MTNWIPKTTIEYKKKQTSKQLNLFHQATLHHMVDISLNHNVLKFVSYRCYENWKVNTI